MTYYRVYLNNNKCSNKTKIDNVRLINNNEIEEYFEPLEILAYSSLGFINNYLVDVITNKKIYLDNGSISPNITYKSKKKVSDKELIDIYNKYKNLSQLEINRYKNGMEKIEKDSISAYKDYIEEINSNHKLYVNAINYFNNYNDNIV